MIERLAVLERQNVDWSSDFVRIQEELQFIEAYLELQKYRFGDRLSYEISAEPDCRFYLLPKLTLVTFVENACVHGVEKKASHCWIYIRAYKKRGLAVSGGGGYRKRHGGRGGGCAYRKNGEL